MARFRDQSDELRTVLQDFAPQGEAVDAIARLVASAVIGGRTLFTCGNGGSAADAIHLAEEMVGRYRGDRRPLAAVCLNTDVGALTCIANDYGYGQVFARQLQALGRPSDVLIVFSTSGGSPNILNVLATAQAGGLMTIAILGKDGGCRPHTRRPRAGRAQRQQRPHPGSTRSHPAQHLRRGGGALQRGLNPRHGSNQLDCLGDTSTTLPLSRQSRGGVEVWSNGQTGWNYALTLYYGRSSSIGTRENTRDGSHSGDRETCRRGP